MPKKRLTTNGNVFRRTDGRWQSVIWYFDERGIKRRKVFSSKTKTEAQQKITNYIAQFNEEVRNSDESQKTIKESLTRWLQVFKFPSVERTTYDRLECTAQHQVFPLIGEKIVGDITAADLKSVLNHWMERGYAYTTVKKVHILLNEYFRYLTEEGFLQKNPMQSVPMMKKANFLAAQDKECVSEQEQVTVFTPTEIARFKREAFSTFSQTEIPASRCLHPHAQHRPADRRIAGPAQQRHRPGAASFASRKRGKRGLAAGRPASRARSRCESGQAEIGYQQAFSALK